MFLPIQQAAIAAITGDQSCVESTREAYVRRRNCLCDGFTAIGWPMERPAATMFVWAAIPSGYETSEAFAMDLVEKAGLIVTPAAPLVPPARVMCAWRWCRTRMRSVRRWIWWLPAGFCQVGNRGWTLSRIEIDEMMSRCFQS